MNQYLLGEDIVDLTKSPVMPAASETETPEEQRRADHELRMAEYQAEQQQREEERAAEAEREEQEFQVEQARREEQHNARQAAGSWPHRT
jgi:ParB family chromosome partitioning protein